MEEERQLHREIKTIFIEGTELPVFYVNGANVRSGVEEFFVTLGTVMPPEILDITELEDIDRVKARALFRFAMPRQVMKDMIGVMQHLYDQQTQQLEQEEALNEPPYTKI